MELVTLNAENLEREHICCAISNNNDCQVAAKKAWLSERFADGLVFCKGNVRGKCFIEYLPAENAWAPIEAPGCMYIDCLWVSGQLAGQGHAAQLLNACVDECRRKGMRGLVALSSDKKRPFLADPGFLRHEGFVKADAAAPYFELWQLPLEAGGEAPRFRDCVKAPHAEENGYVLYYSHQCPYTAKYAPLAEAAARAHGVPFQAVRLKTAAEAQNAPTPYTAYSLFCGGAFITHEILSEKKLDALFSQAARG